jgi:hypothetical protein
VWLIEARSTVARLSNDPDKTVEGEPACWM